MVRPLSVCLSGQRSDEWKVFCYSKSANIELLSSPYQGDRFITFCHGNMLRAAGSGSCASAYVQLVNWPVSAC